MAREYKEQKNAETTVKILELEAILPDFCHGYIVSISGYNKPLTQLAYLQRIQFFLQWLLEYNSFFCKHYTKINEFKVSDLELLKKADFEEFLAHISKLTNEYIKHPSEVVSVGDIVDCYVIDINKEKEKVSLSLIEQ